MKNTMSNLLTEGGCRLTPKVNKGAYPTNPPPSPKVKGKQKDFDKVVRWEGIGNCQHGYLEESDFGDYVTHEDYEILLEAYKELKWLVGDTRSLIIGENV